MNRSVFLPYLNFVCKFATKGKHILPETNAMTLTRFMLQEQRKFKEATGEFSQLIFCVQTAIKAFASAVRMAGIAKLHGISGDINVQGEQVKKLDVLANELFINMLTSSYTACLLVSEENAKSIVIDKEKRGKYIVCFDPLDGSSNVDCLVSIGSIIGIYRKENLDVEPQESDALQPGTKLIAAGYALYGTATVVVFSVGNGTHCFTYDPAIGEFILTELNMRVPEKGTILSINEGYQHDWQDTGVCEYVAAKKDPAKGKPYTGRFVGSLVADIHRTMLYGGIYIFPSTNALPTGKLRLLYECSPISYLLEQAGGLSSNGKIRIMDVVPKIIHERTPAFMGSKQDVEEALSYLKT